MIKPIISVRNLSKIYTLGERLPYYSFRDTLSDIFKTSFKKECLVKDQFYALKDVSFDIHEGDVVGIVGRNGAGKSTLLKILSRITPPTSGEIVLRGRVASLLEVGTGFHSELTGRENIFLNGAILGMTRAEIKKKFEEIVDFAEIEKFLDTPVKHYSSGMYMRLAFSVAAHLEPEILLIDEVLAVGDQQFQQKCLGKMSQVSKQGRTILFVSHNLSAIERLCESSLLLTKGEVQSTGSTPKIISKYINTNKQYQVKEKLNTSNRSGDGEVLFSKIIINSNKNITCGKPFTVQAHYQSNFSILKNCRFGISIKDARNNLCLILSSEQVYNALPNLKGFGMFKILINKLPLSIGTYYLDLFLEVNGVIKDSLQDCYSMNVLDGNYYPDSIRQVPSGFEGRSGVLIDFEIKYDQ